MMTVMMRGRMTRSWKGGEEDGGGSVLLVLLVLLRHSF